MSGIDYEPGIGVNRHCSSVIGLRQSSKTVSKPCTQRWHYTLQALVNRPPATVGSGK